MNNIPLVESDKFPQNSDIGENVSVPTNATPPSQGGAKKATFNGPCYLKMLVSNLVAGSIIGKSGSVIANIEGTTRAAMKLSSAGSFFPGTNDRVVVMSGEQDQINRALSIILEKIAEVTTIHENSGSRDGNNSPNPSSAKVAGGSTTGFSCKLVVPKGSVSGLIGKGGQQIKQLQVETGAKIQISDRFSDRVLNERVVSITGTVESVQHAATQISSAIQSDSNVRDHMYVTYTNMVGPVGGNMYGGPNNSNVAMGMPSVVQFGVQGAGGEFHYGSPNSFPPSQGGLTGPAGPSLDALKYLMVENCEIFLEIPDNYIGPVVGKGGIHLTEIMRATQAIIKLSQKGEFVPGTQNRRVTISGTVSAVHRAHAKLIMRLRESAHSRSMSIGGMPNQANISNPTNTFHGPSTIASPQPHLGLQSQVVNPHAAQFGQNVAVPPPSFVNQMPPFQQAYGHY